MRKLFIISTIVLLSSCTGTTEEERNLIQKVDSLENELSELQRANDTLSDHLAKKTYLTREYPSYFDSIEEPEKYLLENLRQDQNSIPKEAVLGGTMQFTNVSFINNELFIAEYEDGHVLGKAVYTYGLNPSGKFEFKLLGTIR